jgi:hypothetical protein
MRRLINSVLVLLFPFDLKETRMPGKMPLWTFLAVLQACTEICGALLPARSKAIVGHGTLTVSWL